MCCADRVSFGAHSGACGWRISVYSERWSVGALVCLLACRSVGTRFPQSAALPCVRLTPTLPSLSGIRVSRCGRLGAAGRLFMKSMPPPPFTPTPLATIRCAPSRQSLSARTAVCCAERVSFGAHSGACGCRKSVYSERWSVGASKKRGLHPWRKYLRAWAGAKVHSERWSVGTLGILLACYS